MAIYRLYRRLWEKGKRLPLPVVEGSNPSTGKRKREKADAEGDETEHGEFLGGGRKGVSSGLSTVVKRPKNSSKEPFKPKTKWWTELGNGGSKGSVKIKSG